jgi:molybdate transport system substrate-binding protein
VLAKIEVGEADAGIVYASDAQSAAGKVRSVQVPSQFQPRIAYPIAVPHEAVAIGLAKSFIQAVLSPAGQSELRRRGFTSQR